MNADNCLGIRRKTALSLRGWSGLWSPDSVGINRREVVNERFLQEPDHRRCRIEQSETRAEADRGICCRKNTIAVKALSRIGAFCPNRNMAPGRRLSIGEAPRHSP